MALRAHSKDFPPRRFTSRPHPTAVLNIEVLGMSPTYAYPAVAPGASN
ncbi:hypothetical protein M2405_004075 [Rhodococcus erythropolis]|nr:hypothetical protein [Rhodococcus erythropolis]MCW2425287.1 hypothetical protein [Rhodococcus erythropolis]